MPDIAKVLITGANAGLGKECARQLALLEPIQKVYLACRSKEKAEAAQAELEEQTNTTKLEIVVVDVTDSESLRSAVDALPEPIDGLVLNAGGRGPDPLGNSATEGVCNLVSLNLLGHVHLVDLLLASDKLKKGGSVVYSGSEAARGIPNMGSPRPEIESGSEEDFRAICDGTVAKGDEDRIYSFAKMMAALWMGAMARKEPDIRFVTMSPGACHGTEIMKYLGVVKRTIMSVVFKLIALLGKAHNVEVGAKRYVDALMDKETYKNGAFYCSKEGLTGEVSDQAESWDIFAKEDYQDTANTVLRSLLYK